MTSKYTMLLDELVECSNSFIHLFFAYTLPTWSLRLWESGVSSCQLPGVLVPSVVVEFVIAHLCLCWHVRSNRPRSLKLARHYFTCTSYNQVDVYSCMMYVVN